MSGNVKPDYPTGREYREGDCRNLAPSEDVLCPNCCQGTRAQGKRP